MASAVKRRIMQTVEKGERQAEVAREILAIGKRAGIELVQQETDLLQLEDRLRELKAAVEPDESEDQSS